MKEFEFFSDSGARAPGGADDIAPPRLQSRSEAEHKSLLGSEDVHSPAQKFCERWEMTGFDGV